VRRREFITLIGNAAWPLAARAQQSRNPVRLGFVPTGSPENSYDVSLVEAFRQGLRKVGLIENQNVVLDVAWVKSDPDQAVREVLQRGAEVLIPCGSSASAAAQRQNSTIPIVFLNVGDPVAIGVVDSLSNPGRNATGFSDILAELSGKLVDLARELNKSQSSISQPADELDLGRDGIHNFKVVFGFRALGKDKDGGVDNGPYWDALAAFAGDSTYYAATDTGNLICGPIAADVADDNIFGQASKRSRPEMTRRIGISHSPTPTWLRHPAIPGHPSPRSAR
jgi:hypothetical protein